MIAELIREVYKGKTVGRVLFNDQVKRRCGDISGKVIDLASGKNPSYYKFLPVKPSIRADYTAREGIDVVIDLNKKISLPDSQFDAALLFNAIYILKDRSAAFGEIYRILKPGGKLFLTSPFSNIETPEPDDFGRLTAQGLRVELEQAGFTVVSIDRYGERFTSVANLIHPFLIFNTVRAIIYSISIGLDKFIPKSIRTNHPAPLGYFCIAIK